MSIPFEVKKKYNFNTRAPAILGVSIKNAICDGVIGYEVAKMFISPETDNQNIFPALPPGTSPDPKQYTYVLFRSESGAKRVLALEWIDLATVAEVGTQKLTVVIQNVNSGQVAAIRDAVQLLGFNTFTATLADAS